MDGKSEREGIDRHSMQFCTIICRNYLAQARVLGESLRRTYPDCRYSVLVIDHPRGVEDLVDGENFDVIALEDLQIPALDVMKGIYSAIELSTAVKPWLLEHLLGAGGPEAAIAYLDPDIEVYSPMIELEEMLGQSWIVLTPHLTSPNGIDGRTPSEQAILLAGTYNLGFVALKNDPTTPRFLAWWKERLERACVVDPRAGFFVDQRYIDFVPGLFDGVGILRHESYNVAYWNAATRFVTCEEERYLVNGLPLRFFHYSGFSPSRPERLSTHQDRVVLAEREDLATLVGAYSAALLRNDFERFAGVPYPFDRSARSLSIGPKARSLYRVFVDRGFEESLFTIEGEDAFALATTFNSPRFPHLTEAQVHLWENDPGVRAAYPDLEGDDSTRLAEWFRDSKHAGDAYGEVVPRSFPSEESSVERKRPLKPRVVTGVNVVGYFNAPLGVGEIARSIVRSLDVAGVRSTPIALHPPGLRDSVPFPSLPASYGFAFPQTIMCVNADMLPSVMEELRETPASGLYTTGVWWWELDEVPAEAMRAFPLVDELLVGSRFIADALRRDAPVPVSVFPVPVALGEPSPLGGVVLPGDVVWPDGFTFYFSFDCNSVVARKNPGAVLQAFLAAFPRSGEANLVIKSLNGHAAEKEMEDLRNLSNGRDDVVFVDGDVPQHIRDSMVAAADCYVSLHRSEGMGLTMAEAMFAGKPVIATAYSGNLDFMNSDNSILIDYRLIPVGRGAGPYPESALWAEPDIEQASWVMRRTFDDPIFAAALGRRAAVSIRSTNSLQAAASALADCLQYAG